MKYKLVLIIGFISLIFSCENSKQLVNINAENRIIAEELPSNKDIEAVIDPYKINLDKSMTKILSYSTDTYSKNDGNYNTAIGNLMADAIMELSNPIFKSRTGKNLDMVLLNHGGIRSVLSKGNITTRTAYSLMPFENSVIVVALKGTVIMEMTSYLKEFGKPHPISGLELVLNSDNTYNTILIGGEPVEMEKTYHIATNDYLYKGGDQMYFLKKSDTLYDLNYKIRTVLIDYFKTININTSVLSTDNTDQDFKTMITAEYYMPSMGGYGTLGAALNKNNVFWDISDKYYHTYKSLNELRDLKLFKEYYYKNKYPHNDTAIVGLVRGYERPQQYNTLIERNKVLAKNNQKNIDYIISSKPYVVIQIKDHIVNATIELLDPWVMRDLIKKLKSLGYSVVLIGREAMPEQFSDLGVVDYANSQFVSVEDDFQLIYNSECMISSASGVCNIAEVLDKPLLVLNSWHHIFQGGKKTMVLPRLLRKEGKILHAREQLRIMLDDRQSISSVRALFEVVPIDSNDVLAALDEFFEDLVFGDLAPFRKLQSCVRDRFLDTPLGVGLSRVPESYIERYPDVFL